MFFPTANFAFAADLQQQWREIRDEFDRLDPHEFIPWHETFLYEGRWDVFGLYAFGEVLADNCRRCPRTAELVSSIPGMTTAGFSVLGPGTRIQPHTGYTGEVLRCHLGLRIPADCGLRIGSETAAWSEGECLIFDDTVDHEAWNRSMSSRAVLLVDFRRAAHVGTCATHRHD